MTTHEPPLHADCGTLRGEQCPPGYVANYTDFTELVAEHFAEAASATGGAPPAIIHVIAGSGSGFNTADDVAQAVELFNELVYDGINVDVIHAERTQQQRDNVVKQFRAGRVWVLIAEGLARPLQRLDLAIRRLHRRLLLRQPPSSPHVRSYRPLALRLYRMPRCNM